MRVDLQKFEQLYGKLFEVDYKGAVPGICVSLNSAASIRAATSKGAHSRDPLARNDGGGVV